MVALLFILCCSSCYFLLQATLTRRKRWRQYYKAINFKLYEHRITKLLRLSLNSPGANHYMQLLQGCGLSRHHTFYLIIRRSVIIINLLLTITMLLAVRQAVVGEPIFVTTGLIVLTLWLLIVSDKHILNIVKQRRRELIIHDIHTVSKQLLYYRGAKLNIHSKIKRCLPFTTTIRRELDLLIKEWYEGAGLAIDKFKQRIGTEEGHSFAETMNALRLNDDARYYDLLRQRIVDYKEKIELQRESKKETSSYMLFVIAGLPILNTFRVFIYPWVQEGQRLFESLN